MNKDQHGGRSFHSTSTCLGEILEDSREALEANLHVAIMAVDLTAAYDLCDHGLLQQKCRVQLNLDEGTLCWLRSFLSNRYQLVEINGSRSTPLPSGNKGVVQGGPSSGLLFNIYINELPTVVNGGSVASQPLHSTHKQYVDDGSVIARGRTLNELKSNLEDDFKNIQSFLHRHKMVINADKTQLMLLQSSNKDVFQVDLVFPSHMAIL